MKINRNGKNVHNYKRLYIIYFILLISLKEIVVVKANVKALYFGVYTNTMNDWDK